MAKFWKSKEIVFYFLKSDFPLLIATLQLEPHIKASKLNKRQGHLLEEIWYVKITLSLNDNEIKTIFFKVLST